MKVLHLIGSSSSDFYFQCSLMYARCLSEELQYNKKYRTSEALEIIEEISPDVMLQHIQCEKKYTYNALFEILNIPYIGSDSQVSANIVDKGVTRAILAQAGVGVPSGVVITRNDDSSDYRAAFPAVVKPTRMENSVGVSLVRDRQEMEAALESCWSYGDTAVIDTFIPGREVRCGAVELMEGKVEALGCIEYKVARDTIRTYGDKLEGDDDQLRQAASTTSWFIEETEEPELVRKLQKIAIKIHRVMGCRDFSQYDCRVTDDGEVYVLEVNNFCSFGPLSLVPKIAGKQGIAPARLYNGLLDKAARRGMEKSSHISGTIKPEY